MNVSTTTSSPMFVHLGRKRIQVASLADASSGFVAMRDRAGFGASRTPTPLITDADGNVVGYVAYNGRVFPRKPSEWKPGTVPLYDPLANSGVQS